MALTPPGQTRQRVYEFIRERVLAGRAPSLREIQRHLGFRAVQAAKEHVDKLVGEGRLLRTPGEHRGYHLPGLPKDHTPPVLVPLLGRVRAGALSEAIEDVEGYLPVQSKVPKDVLLALRVRGDSMIEAHIADGDLVIVRRQPTATHGDVVVALVNGEATVKTFQVRRGRPVLVPANPAYPVIVPDPAELSILGKVVEVRRYLETIPLVRHSA